MSLQILGASKRYGEVYALNDVSLVLADHQVHAIVGPSGSGKTTLLQAICGLERLDRGTIHWNHIEFQRDQTYFLPPERRQIGMVFQDFALFPHLTVGQNIAFGLGVRHWSTDRVQARLQELLTLLHLEGLQDRYPHELSGGQKQRTAVARALAPDPRLLLLDESLSSLDAALRRTLQHELRDLFKKLHLTVILVTHDPTEALVMADNIAVMSQGRVISVNPPQTLYERPDSAIAAQLMGLVTLWPGRVVESRGQYAVVDLESCRVSIPATGLPVGTAVMTVIRPSSCYVTSSREPGIDVQVSQVRYMGDYFLVTGQYGNNTLHFYLDRPPKERETVQFNPERLWCYPVDEADDREQQPAMERKRGVGP
ncbi:ABC transporter ATP-binding protein [Sulfobacillus harzensis]|uniref:ABC-type quaternary amine transporter n=1 Tax=Sulfobacillus harzensis TaxID=2729629 RepID=A0A7Y0L4I6_9FIRM|nr:ABC transporter ATP-binding protein [Sulfobacillus harzensis]NMP23168.1 ABC transporter ATP-binding protein [Sulfobacillus harzensis]